MTDLLCLTCIFGYQCEGCIKINSKYNCFHGCVSVWNLGAGEGRMSTSTYDCAVIKRETLVFLHPILFQRYWSVVGEEMRLIFVYHLMDGDWKLFMHSHQQSKPCPDKHTLILTYVYICRLVFFFSVVQTQT